MRVLSLLIVAGTVGLPRVAEAQIRKGPYLQDVRPTGLTIRVEVDPAQAAALDVDGKPTILDNEARALHDFKLTELEAGKKYGYAVRVGGATERGTFTTAPKDAHARFSFLVYGDNRTDPIAHAAVVRAMAQAPSDFLVNTGDFVEDGRDADQWREFFDVERPLLKDRCLFACVGNHELLDRAGENYIKYFAPADTHQLYGSFRWGNARFFLLNGQDTFDEGPEREWLVRELDKAKNEDLAWRVVVVHFGYRSAGPHGDNPRLLAGGVDRLLKEKKVDLVISGHDHIYERGEHEGMRYVVSGGGGAPLYRVKAPLPSTRKVEPTYHYILFEVSDDAVKLSAKRVDGSVVDVCGFGHAPGWDCDGTGDKHASLEPLPNPASAPPSSTTSSSRCGCAAQGEARGAAPFATLGLGLILALRRRFRYARG